MSKALTGFCRPTEFAFQRALEMLQDPPKVIVEIGTLRDPRPIAAKTDGHSTLHWLNTGAEVYSVDSSPRAIAIAEAFVQQRKTDSNVSFIVADGINFLSEFSKEIDLLYLDGPSKDMARYHLDCFDAAPLQEHCVVLIDDTDLPNKGKGELVIPRAEQLGFDVVEFERQVILVR